MAKQKACDLDAVRRLWAGKKGEPGSEAYLRTGLAVAESVLRRRRSFTSHDIEVRGRGIDPRTTNIWRGEFLSAFSEPTPGISAGARSIIRACPRLQAKTQKLWKGW